MPVAAKKRGAKGEPERPSCLKCGGTEHVRSSKKLCREHPQFGQITDADKRKKTREDARALEKIFKPDDYISKTLVVQKCSHEDLHAVRHRAHRVFVQELQPDVQPRANERGGSGGSLVS